MPNALHIDTMMRSMKTGFLKWRPDFDIAADEYQKAGKTNYYFAHFFFIRPEMCLMNFICA